MRDAAEQQHRDGERDTKKHHVRRDAVDERCARHVDAFAASEAATNSPRMRVTGDAFVSALNAAASFAMRVGFILRR